VNQVSGLYIDLGDALEHDSEAYHSIGALIEKQRDRANSTDISRRLRILWITARLDKLLAHSTDRQLGDLMGCVLERFGMFEPEFAICYHARRRLLLTTAEEKPSI
jgi:heme oxygenase